MVLFTTQRRALALFLSCCAATWVAAPVLATAAEEKRILILGDSLTKGYGLTLEQAFPALLQKKAKEAGFTGHVVLNGGVSGDTTAGGLRRMGWLLKKRVDVLVIALGGNDGLRGVDPDETAKNLQAIIEKARKANPDIRLLLAGMEMPQNMGQEYIDRYQRVFPAIAKKNKIPLIPFLLKGVGGDPKLNQPDRIHPNEEGQKVLAETVWKPLELILRGKN
jgi:acyl-CoA thioesterase-1